MSKNSKKGQFKKINLQNKKKLMLELRFILVNLNDHINELEKVLNKLFEEINYYREKDLNEIPMETYSLYKSLIQYHQFNLLKNVADDSKSVYSYIKIRKELTRLKLGAPTNEDLLKILNDKRDLRNWLFHNCITEINSKLESDKKLCPKELRPYLEINFNSTIILQKPKTVTWAYLFSLFDEYNKRLNIFKYIFNFAKQDLENLCEQKVNIIEQIIEKPIDFTKEQIIQSSIEKRMQENKYDDSLELDEMDLFAKKIVDKK